MTTTKENQVVWASPAQWWNEVTVYDIHTHESRDYGYAEIDSATYLVRRFDNVDLPIWQVVGVLRKE